MTDTKYRNIFITQSFYHLSPSSSTFLEELFFWTTKEGVGKEVNGAKYIYNTLEEWVLRIKKYCRCTIWRSINSLREKGIVLFEQFNKHSYDRTGYYSIDWGRLESINRAYFESEMKKGKLEKLILSGFPLQGLEEYKTEILATVSRICERGAKKQLLRQNLNLPSWVEAFVKGYEKPQSESKLDYRKPEQEKPMLKVETKDPYFGKESPRYQTTQSRLSPMSQFIDGPWMDKSEDEWGRTHQTISRPFYEWCLQDIVNSMKVSKKEATSIVLSMFKKDGTNLLIRWETYCGNIKDRALSLKSRVDAGGSVTEEEKGYILRHYKALLSIPSEYQVITPEEDGLTYDSPQEVYQAFQLSSAPEIPSLPKETRLVPTIVEDASSVTVSCVEVAEVPVMFTEVHKETEILSLGKDDAIITHVEGFTSIGNIEEKQKPAVPVASLSTQEVQLQRLAKLYEVGLMDEATYQQRKSELETNKSENNQIQAEMENVMRQEIQADYSELPRINQLLSKLNNIQLDILTRDLSKKYPNYIYLMDSGKIKAIYPPNQGEILVNMPINPSYEELPLLNDFLVNCPRLRHFLPNRLQDKYRGYILNTKNDILYNIQPPTF